MYDFNFAVLFVLLFVEIFALVAVYLFAKRPSPSRSDTTLSGLLQKIRRNARSDASAFCLGRDAGDPTKFKNVYVNENAPENASESDRFVVRSESAPVNVVGELVADAVPGAPTSHGRITDEEELGGFRISGVTTADGQERLACPSDSFGGSRCELKPLCDDEDRARQRIKLLNFDQFAALRLYDRAHHEFVDESAVASTRDGDGTVYHPRLKIECLPQKDVVDATPSLARRSYHDETTADAEFRIIACAANEIIDSADAARSFPCVPYDICEDRLLNGAKHHADIGRGRPSPNEYYLCANNVSVLKQCSPADSVFSERLGACIAPNACYGRGNINIVLGDNDYVACKNDSGHRVHCPAGLNFDPSTDELLGCRVPKCVERRMIRKTEALEYNYGAVQCGGDDGETPVTVLCRESPSATDRTSEVDVDPYRHSFHWGGSDITIGTPGWPVEIYDPVERRCVRPTRDSGILKSAAPLSIAGVLASSTYDYARQTFVCSDRPNYRYRRDYATNKLYDRDGAEVSLDASRDGFADPSTPCVSSLMPLTRLNLDAFKSLPGFVSLNFLPIGQTPLAIVALLSIDDATKNETRPATDYEWMNDDTAYASTMMPAKREDLFTVGVCRVVDDRSFRLVWLRGAVLPKNFRVIDDGRNNGSAVHALYANLARDIASLIPTGKNYVPAVYVVAAKLDSGRLEFGPLTIDDNSDANVETLREVTFRYTKKSRKKHR